MDGPPALSTADAQGLQEMTAKKASLWHAGLQTRESLATPSLCCRPIILDPADPTHNVAEGYRWDIVSQRACQCLKQDCCYDNKDNPIPSWNVKVMALLRAGCQGREAQNEITASCLLIYFCVDGANRALESDSWGLAAPPAL